MIEDGSMQEGDRVLLFPKDVVFTKEILERTDDKQEAIPFLRVKEKVQGPDGPKWTRAEMYDHLLTQF